MAVLFCGGELEDFVTAGSVTAVTTAGNYRSAYSRLGVNADGAAWGTNYIRAPFTASSSVGVTGRLYTGATSISAGAVFLWLASGGSARLRLKANTAGPTTLTLESYTSGGVATALATSTSTISISTLYRFDLLVSYGAAGRARLWVDGGLYLDTGTMDITASGSTTLDSSNFGNTRTASQTAPWSEIIVTDGEDPRPLMLKTLVPNGAGDTSQWTGAYTDVDEATADPLDILSSGTAGQITNMDCTGMPAGASGLSVRAVKVVASALAGTGPGKLALGVKSGSTQSFGTDQTLTAGYAGYSEAFTTNPATGSAFTGAEIDALKLAIRSAT